MSGSPFSKILITERLHLRPLDLSDVDLIWPGISDPEIAKLMAWDAHVEKSQTLKFLENEVDRYKSERGITWAIIKDNNFCGIISIISINRQHRALTFNRGELAYWIDRRHQRQGIASEAIQAVIFHGFTEIKLHKLVVSHHSGNMASQALIQRSGFRYIGTQLSEFSKDGIWYDHWLYEMLDRDFEGGHLNRCDRPATPLAPIP